MPWFIDDDLLENTAILSAKGGTFGCILWDINRNDGLKRLHSSVLEDKVFYNWEEDSSK